MNLGDAKESYTRRKEIPFSSEQKWMAVRCSPKNEVSLAVVKRVSLWCPGWPGRLLPQHGELGWRSTPPSLTKIKHKCLGGEDGMPRTFQELPVRTAVNLAF